MGKLKNMNFNQGKFMEVLEYFRDRKLAQSYFIRQMRKEFRLLLLERFFYWSQFRAYLSKPFSFSDIIISENNSTFIVLLIVLKRLPVVLQLFRGIIFLSLQTILIFVRRIFLLYLAPEAANSSKEVLPPQSTKAHILKTTCRQTKDFDSFSLLLHKVLLHTLLSFHE